MTDVDPRIVHAKRALSNPTEAGLHRAVEALLDVIEGKPLEDERVRAARRAVRDEYTVLETAKRCLGDLLAAYDELKATVPAGERTVEESWGVRTNNGFLHTTDIGGYRMRSREAAEKAGFDAWAKPKPVLLSRVVKFSETGLTES
jgi:hypothetical protein